MRALVVDDHPEIRHALAAALSRRGHEVAAFADSESAWRAWGEEPFPLVLLDVWLPGEDGMALCRRLRADPFGASSVILFVTGSVDPDDLSQLLEAGGDDYLAKPFSGGELEIRLAVAERRAAEVAERWRVRGELIETEARFAAFMDHCPAIAWLKDDQGRLVYVNAAFERAYGVTRAEALGKCDEDLYPAAAAALRANDARVLTTGEVVEGVETVLTPDGTTYHWLGSKFLFRDASGARFVGGMAIDITDRYRAEHALAEERELLRTIMDNVPDFLYVKDRASRFVRMNRASARFMGLNEPAEAIGKTDFDFFPESLASQFFADEQSVIATGVPVLNRLESQNAEGTVWALTSTVPIFDASGEVTGVIGVSRDVTERRRVEEALRLSEERQRALLAAIPDLMFRFDRDGTYLDCNDGESSNLVRPVDELIGMRLRDALPAEAGRVCEQAVARAIDGGGVQVVEYDLVTVAGQPVRFEARVVACGRDEALMIVRDVTERRALEERLAHQATHDPLTGLPNRTLLADRLEHALARSERQGKGVALLFVDLDDFKVVNDTLGHEYGDRLLVAVAQKLRESVRGADSVARLGGDEFAILLEDVVDPAEPVTVAARIRERLTVPIDLGGRDVVAPASLGVAIATSGRVAPSELLRQADAAMYAAKRSGKAQHAVYAAGMDLDAWDRLGLDGELRGAIERGEFVVHYQPVVSPATGAVSAVEALVRWQHPVRGLLSPAEFVPLAEETGLIVPIGRWVLATACRQAVAWQERIPSGPPLRVCVNLSAREFRDPQLASELERARAESGLQAENLQLEVSEAALLDDVAGAAAILARLRALGFAIVLDGFGAGSAGFGYLRQLPIDVLKIDRTIIAEMSGPDDTALLRSVVELGHALGKRVAAVGLETSWQVELARELGFVEVQGVAISPPVSADAMAMFLELRARSNGHRPNDVVPLAS